MYVYTFNYHFRQNWVVISLALNDFLILFVQFLLKTKKTSKLVECSVIDVRINGDELLLNTFIKW